MKGFSRTMQNNCIIFFLIRVMYLVIEIGLTDLKKFMNKCATNWQVLGMEKYFLSSLFSCASRSNTKRCI